MLGIFIFLYVIASILHVLFIGRLWISNMEEYLDEEITFIETFSIADLSIILFPVSILSILVVVGVSFIVGLEDFREQKRGIYTPLFKKNKDSEGE